MKRNIAIIVQKLTGGGAERTAANLSVNLSKYYNVFLYVFNTSSITYPYSGMLRTIDKASYDSAVGKTTNILRRIHIIRELKKQDNIDVSISFLNFANFVNVLSARRDKTIISIRNNVESLASRADKIALAISMKKADRVVSLSKSVEKQLVAQFHCPDKNLTIYNAVPAQNIEMDIYAGPSGKFFATTGRLTKQKGHWHLIKAMSVVCKKYPDVQLVILGEGELLEPLQKLVNDLHLQKNVTLYGYCPNPAPVVKASQAFVFSSLFEGLGNSIVEALSLGKYIISTDCPHGPAELLNDSFCSKHTDAIQAKYGVLVPAFDDGMDFSTNITDAEFVLADEMIRVLEDPELKAHYEVCASERAKDFSEQVITHEWVKLVESVL